ncbi:hypothetical protein MRX96_022370 [Rhipicephalus microplus]
MLTQSQESLLEKRKSSSSTDLSGHILHETADQTEKTIASDQVIVASPDAEEIELSEATGKKIGEAVSAVPDNASKKSGSDNEEILDTTLAEDHMEIYSPAVELAPLGARKENGWKYSRTLSGSVVNLVKEKVAPCSARTPKCSPGRPRFLRLDRMVSRLVQEMFILTLAKAWPLLVKLHYVQDVDDGMTCETTYIADGTTSTATAIPSAMSRTSLGATAGTSVFCPSITTTLDISSAESEDKARAKEPPDGLAKSICLTYSKTTENLTSDSSLSHNGTTETISSRKAPSEVRSGEQDKSCQKTIEGTRPRFILHKTRIFATTPTQSVELVEETVTQIASLEQTDDPTINDKSVESKQPQDATVQASTAWPLNDASVDKSLEKKQTLLKNPSSNLTGAEEKTRESCDSQTSQRKERTKKDSRRFYHRSATKPPVIQRTRICAGGLSHSVEIISEQSLIKDLSDDSNKSYHRIQTPCYNGRPNFLSRPPGLKDVPGD